MAAQMTDPGGKIRVVDDEEAIQKLLRYPLEKEGYQVVQARDGQEALDAFGLEPFDLVILDVLMPAIHGTEVGGRPRQDLVHVDGLDVGLPKRNVDVRGKRVDLTYIEFELLKTLISHPGRVYSRQILLQLVWGDAEFRDARTVDVHIRHLREKIERDARSPEFIFTVRNIGYKFREF